MTFPAPPIGPPTPGPNPGSVYLPGIKLTTVKFWDNGSYQTPTWTQIVIKATVSHLELSSCLNHYVSVSYRIIDWDYLFYPNQPVPPPYTDPNGNRHEPWFKVVELQKMEEDGSVIWSETFTHPPGVAQFSDFGGIEVEAILYGGNGDDFGMEELHQESSDYQKYELKHTMFGTPINPNTLAEEGDIVLP